MPQYQDLFMRDTFADTGVTPIPDSGLSTSPDIIPYGESVLNVATAPYGPPLLDKPINANNVNNVYVRAKNLAPGASSGKVYVYWTPATLLTNVPSWSHHMLSNFNGNKYANLSAETSGQVVFGDQPFYWTPGEGHFCLLARVETLANPNPLPPPFSTWTEFVDWISTHANVAWHNVDVVATLPPQGYQNSLVFQNGDYTQFYTFTVTYSGVPAGSVLRVWAPSGAKFLGFDTGPRTIGGSGILPIAATFPPKYQTTVFATCVFPGGPVKPPGGASIVLSSWGPQTKAELEKKPHFLQLSVTPEDLGMDREETPVGPGGAMVMITSFTTEFVDSSAAT